MKRRREKLAATPAPILFVEFLAVSNSNAHSPRHWRFPRPKRSISFATWLGATPHDIAAKCQQKFGFHTLHIAKRLIDYGFHPMTIYTICYRSAMRNEIESSLQALIGLPLLSVGRAADLEWFLFGSPRTVTNFKGETRVVGEYALHVQCAWRIRDSARIIVASNDRYEPAEVVEDLENFDWDRPGANLCDRKMRQFLAEAKGGSQIVTQVEADDVGFFPFLRASKVKARIRC